MRAGGAAFDERPVRLTAVKRQRILLPEQRKVRPDSQNDGNVAHQHKLNVFKQAPAPRAPMYRIRHTPAQEKQLQPAREHKPVYAPAGDERQEAAAQARREGVIHAQRDALPVLCDGDGVLWVPGFPPRDGTEASAQCAAPVFIGYARDPDGTAKSEDFLDGQSDQ